MALIGVFGVPGSGKSYYAVSEIISDSDTFVIGNIKLNEKSSITGYKYLTQTDMLLMNEKIKEIMEYEKVSHDEKKVRLFDFFMTYVDDFKDFHTYTILIDEAHIYGYRSSVKNKWIDDFVSIHRHISDKLKFDIILMTQVSTRLSLDIREQFVKVVSCMPSELRMKKDVFEYEIYSDHDAYKKRDKILQLKKMYVKAKLSTFELYESGFKEQGTGSFRKKFIYMIVALLLVVAFTVSRFYNMFNRNKYVSDSDINITKDGNSTNEKNVTREHVVRCFISPFADKENKLYLYSFPIGNKQVQNCYKSYDFDNF